MFSNPTEVIVSMTGLWNCGYKHYPIPLSKRQSAIN
jgi:hypothetical protein